MRRRFLLTAWAGSLLPSAFAQNTAKQQHIVRWIVPYPAGGTADAIARRLAEATSKKIGRTIVIDNKSGANGSIGTAEVARSAPDGNTFGFLIPDPLTTVVSMIKKPGYDPRTDITPIIRVTEGQAVLVANTSLGVKSMKELIRAAKSKPDSISYATYGPGTQPHLVFKSLEKETGTSFSDIPYKGMGPAITDLIGNSIQLMLLTTTMALQLQQRGSVIPLTVMGTGRDPDIPSIPSIQEEGIDSQALRATAWTILVGPKGLSKALTDEWSEVIRAVAAGKEFQESIRSIGLRTNIRSGEDLKKDIEQEFEWSNRMIRELGIKPV